MLRRFRLERKSDYEKLMIAQRLADMLEKFLSGRLAPLSIGAEQGDIDEWDDVVIMQTTMSIYRLSASRLTFVPKILTKLYNSLKKPERVPRPPPRLIPF